MVHKLKAKGCPKVVVYDLARDDMSQAISDAFRYSKLILATTTYNASIYPFMNDFITRLVEHNYQNRTVVLIENGTWAPTAGRQMREILSGMKDMEIWEDTVTVKSALKEDQLAQIDQIVNFMTK